ncbi:MAG TPA: hypothetical protein VGG02_04320 [Chthoniobacterales bacterium]|jgi:hypothetical protein
MKACLRLCFFCCVPAFLIPLTSKGGSATWAAAPATNDWNTAANWTPNTVPSGPDDVATFGVSNVTTVSLSDFTEVGEIVFEPGASAYILNALEESVGFSFQGAGVSNRASVSQNFVSSQTIGFFSHSNAGSDIVYTNAGNANNEDVNSIGFLDHSRADSATLINAPVAGDPAALISFSDFASADQSTIINNGTQQGYGGGSNILFYDSSTAGESTITIYGGTYLLFEDTSSAGQATLLANGGAIYFNERSDGGTARVVLNQGALFTQKLGAPLAPVTLGSLEGNGLVSLGRPLNVGSNGMSTTFSGVITSSSQDDILSKVGGGTLTLSGTSSNVMGVTVKQGALMLSNRKGSATGNGPVKVTGGSLGGSGIIAGTVTVGTGSGSGAFLAPAGLTDKPATLTIEKALTFDSDATYTCTLQASKKKSANDEVVANGVMIASGAQFKLVAKVQGKPKAGTGFTVISNTASTPISGTFTNLADGAILTVGNTKLQASYEGGDGNDLTLTVVP